jgi:hypothetical protein
MTEPPPAQGYRQIPFPFDDQEAENADSPQRQVLRTKIRYALAAGDTAGASLLLQLAMLQTLERIEDRLGEFSRKLDEAMAKGS